MNTNTTENRTLRAAIAYATRLGWRVLPVHGVDDAGRCTCQRDDCASPGKHPIISEWTTAASTSEGVISAWLSRRTDANVGVATGPDSGVWVLDVDDVGAFDALCEEHGDHEAKVIAETPRGGLHLVYAWPADGRTVPSKTANPCAGIDTRGAGGMVVLMPSKNGVGEYAWRHDESPFDEKPGPAPEWLLRLVCDDVERPEQDPEPEPERELTEAELERIADALRAIPADDYDNEWIKVGMALHSTGAGEQAFALWCDWSTKSEKFPGETALREKWRSFRRDRVPRVQLGTLFELAKRHGWERPATPEVPGFELSATDVANAKRFVELHGAGLRYCAARGGWFVYDGKRWVRDELGTVREKAKDVFRSVLQEAAKEPDEDRAKLLAKFARESADRRRINAMIELAGCIDGIAVSAEAFDRQPYRVNTLDGVVDLRTLELHPHDPNDLVTKLAPVHFDPNATSDEWDRFLDDATGGDQKLAGFLQRCAGYSLCGDPVEEILLFVHGPTAAGKSTFLRALQAAFGDYARTADFESFARHSMSSATAAREDIARLAGSRLVTSIELEEARALAEGLVKMLTGGDRIAARHLYRETFEFDTTFVLWLAANHAPKVDDRDDALWRRILRVPFEHTVPEDQRDPQLKKRLQDDPDARAAVFAWTARGARAWIERGNLAVPDSVKEATASYRRDLDPLHEFLEDHCAVVDDAWCRSAELWQAYSEWAKDNGERFPLGRRQFTDRLRDLGCVPESRTVLRGRKARGWAGIGLLADQPAARSAP